MKKKILSLLVAILILATALTFASCSDGLPWSDSALSKMIPIPVSTRREVVADEADVFSVDVYNYSQKMFQDYVAFCDVVGFRKGAEATEATYSAYHVNGAQLEISFLAEEGRMRIDLVSMTSRGFAEKILGEVELRLDGVEADILAVKSSIDALPVYKIAAPGEVNSTMETAELRGFIYRLYPTITALEGRLGACAEKRDVLSPSTLDEDLLAVYEALGTRVETVSTSVFSLMGSAYGLENALDSLHRQKPAPTDLAEVEQMLISIATELSRLTQALESPSFEIRVEKTEKGDVYRLDEQAFYEALCETVPGLTDLGITLEKCEDALFDMVEGALDEAADRERYATLETQLLKLRRSHYLSLDAATEQELVYERYREGTELFPQEESMAVLPDFPTLQVPLEAVNTQIEELRAGIEELGSMTETGTTDSQALIERAHTTVVKLHLALTECTETAVKMRRAGTCYPNTSPASQPVFDGLEDRITEQRRSLNALLTALEQLELSRNDRLLTEIESTVSRIESEIAGYVACVQDIMNLLKYPEQVDSADALMSKVKELGTRMDEAADSQKKLGDRLNVVIEVKTGSLIASEVERARRLEQAIYEMNGTLGNYIETMRSLQKAVRELAEK